MHVHECVELSLKVWQAGQPRPTGATAKARPAGRAAHRRVVRHARHAACELRPAAQLRLSCAERQLRRRTLGPGAAPPLPRRRLGHRLGAASRRGRAWWRKQARRGAREEPGAWGQTPCRERQQTGAPLPFPRHTGQNACTAPPRCLPLTHQHTHRAVCRQVEQLQRRGTSAVSHSAKPRSPPAPPASPTL